MDNLKLAPLRSFDDFMVTSSRFQVPDLQNSDRYLNRIVANLLYYQTNYFLGSVIVFCIITLMQPQQMFLGLLTFSFIVGTMFYARNEKERTRQFLQQQSPAVLVGMVMLMVFIISWGFGFIMTFFLALGIPIIFVMLHASLRLRNVKNKLVNASEALGVSRATPMSLILSEIGFDTNKIISKPFWHIHFLTLLFVNIFNDNKLPLKNFIIVMHRRGKIESVISRNWEEY